MSVSNCRLTQVVRLNSLISALRRSLHNGAYEYLNLKWSHDEDAIASGRQSFASRDTAQRKAQLPPASTCPRAMLGTGSMGMGLQAGQWHILSKMYIVALISMRTTRGPECIKA